MELFYSEQKARSVFGCVVFLFLLFLAVAFILVTIAEAMNKSTLTLLPGLASTWLVFWCFSYIYGFIKNEVWRFGIRDDFIWWDSPRFPRSAGSIPLSDVCKVTIYEGSGRMDIITRNGTSQRIPCFRTRKAKDVLSEHYPWVAIEFIEGT